MSVKIGSDIENVEVQDKKSIKEAESKTALNIQLDQQHANKAQDLHSNAGFIMKSQTNGIGLNPKQKVPVSELLEGNQDLDELDLKKQFSLGTSSCRSACGSEQSDKESNQQMISRNKTLLDVDSFQQFLNDSSENYSQ